MTGILDGTDSLILKALRLDEGLHLDRKTACKKISASPERGGAIEALVANLYDRIEANWSGRTPSQQNWRLRRQADIAARNKSPEVVLERALAVLGAKGVLDDWYNQIPVASGLIDHRADKRAAIDLVRADENSADFIELKWASDTPLFAAFEILRYGLVYLFCRDKREEFGYEAFPLMGIRNVSLQVLAPVKYYSSFDLGFLASAICTGLDMLCYRRSDGLQMSFEFLSFPSDFELPFSSGADVRRAQDDPLSEKPYRYLVDIIGGLQPVWKAASL